MGGSPALRRWTPGWALVCIPLPSPLPEAMPCRGGLPFPRPRCDIWDETEPALSLSRGRQALGAPARLMAFKCSPASSAAPAESCSQASVKQPNGLSGPEVLELGTLEGGFPRAHSCAALHVTQGEVIHGSKALQTKKRE